MVGSKKKIKNEFLYSKKDIFGLEIQKKARK